MNWNDPYMVNCQSDAPIQAHELEDKCHGKTNDNWSKWKLQKQVDRQTEE